MTYDVIVVGSGAGAMTAAYLSARAGLSTAVVEGTALLGGTSAYSGAACWLPGTDVQARAGIADSTEAARTYLGALLGTRDLAHQEAFLATSPELVRTLEEDPALSFEWRAFPDYFDRPGRVPGGRSFVPVDLPLEEIGERAALVRPPVDRDRAGRGHRDEPLSAGRALIGRLLLALDRTGNGTVLTDTPVDGLVVEDGRVVGVTSANRTLRARRAVVVGAGGFERSAERRAAAGVPGRAAWSMAPAGTNTGEVLAAAIAVGAATALMDQGWWCPGIAMPDGGASFTLGFRGGIVVDRDGRRYANESLPYDQMGRAMAEDPATRVPSYVVFDDREGGRLPAISLPGGRPEEHLGGGTWLQADTIEELAGLIGLPAGALRATVDRFNGFAEAGRDEDFGRGEDEYARYFARPVLVPIDRPPFRAARLVLSDLGTKGGLVTDADARVLRADNSAIAGLYAVGNAAASMTGTFYPGPGIPIGTAMAFAARAVADLSS
ncbi:MAG TPA: FAD-dependent oxidoreductase [Nocardioides sp.]|nr:FAD-dependent oxidoreductase [Nocardioides sp.]